MNFKSGIAPIISIIVIVAIIAGAVVVWQYLETKKEVGEPAGEEEEELVGEQEEEELTGEQEEGQSADWKNLIPDIKEILKSNVAGDVDISEFVFISKEEDITGDNTPESLITFNRGATTEQQVLMRLENKKPVMAIFKQKDGKVLSLVFSSGAGGAGRYGSNTELLKDKKAISFTRHYAYGEESDYCKAEVYVWNPQIKIFEYNSSLSIEVSKNYCMRICNEVGQEADLLEYFKNICREH